MTTFAMKGHIGKLYHGAHSRTPLEIKGTWSMTGRQPVKDDGGVPVWVDELMENNPDIQQIAISLVDNGVVWTRIKP